MPWCKHKLITEKSFKAGERIATKRHHCIHDKRSLNPFCWLHIRIWLCGYKLGNSGQIFAKIPLVYVTSLVKLLLDMKTHVGPPCKMLLIFPHPCEQVLSNIFLIMWESFQHYMHRITFVWWTLQTWLLTMQICGWNSSPTRHVF